MSATGSAASALTGAASSKALLKNADSFMLQKAANGGSRTRTSGSTSEDHRCGSRGVADRISKGVEFLMKKNRTHLRIRHADGQGSHPSSTGVRPPRLMSHIILAPERAQEIPGVAIDRNGSFTTPSDDLPSQPDP